MPVIIVNDTVSLPADQPDRSPSLRDDNDHSGAHRGPVCAQPGHGCHQGEERECAAHTAQGEAACAQLHAFLLHVEIRRSFFLKGDGCFIHAPASPLWFCLRSLFSNAAMQGCNFPTNIHSNICTERAPDYCTFSIHITPLVLMKQFGVPIPCDSKCATRCKRRKSTKFNLPQSVMEICKMARFPVNERTIDNAIQLAARAAICIPVKGVIV